MSKLGLQLKAATEALGTQTLAAELGITLQARDHIDSTAAESICEREGLDKLRHIEVGVLRLQEQAVRRNLPLLKVAGTSNPADLMTNNLPNDEIDKYMDMMGMEFKGGRATNAPEVYHEANLAR